LTLVRQIMVKSKTDSGTTLAKREDILIDVSRALMEFDKFLQWTQVTKKSKFKHFTRVSVPEKAVCS
jgi:hypothetical protein